MMSPVSPHLPKALPVPHYVAPAPQFFMPPAMAFGPHPPVPPAGLPASPLHSVPLPEQNLAFPVQGARCAPVDCLQSNCLPANWTLWATEDEGTHGTPQPVGPEYRNLFSTRAENSTFPSPDSFRVSEELDVKLWRAASFYAHPGSATDHVSAAQQALADVRASS